MEMIIKNNSNYQEKPMHLADLSHQNDSLSQINANEHKQRQKSKDIDSKKRWSKEENLLLLSMYAAHGAKWELISNLFNDRSAVSVKNHLYGLCRKMSFEKRNELKLQRISSREPQSIHIFRETSLNLPSKTEEDLIVESFLADELKPVDRMELDKKWITANLNPQDANLNDPQKIQEKLYEKLNDLKKLSALLEKQLLCRLAWYKAMPKDAC